ncbi:DUF1826 domain-containing protein [Paraconexibacter algicola]|uniref:DUF1826 domain-containing protein n=1 Tax=Paraconexibacter algicola TaxID=2133960 RepID=A0A2T4UHU2_9ACTN|nr:DUF1826 domain-containing protein [Paraconexibacter algicola]PTL58798.1 hypothetical protein C7Y72_03600 [Paraconexibacter algicola]
MITATATRTGLGQVVRATVPSDADAILDPAAALWRWERHLPDATARQAATLARTTRHAVRGEVPVADRVPAIEALLDELAPGRAADRRALTHDIAALAFLLARVGGATRVAVRIETDPSAGCPLLHVDSVALRLLCTYVGPGTAWLAEADAVREELGLRGRTPEQANAAIAPDASAIRHLAPGEVGILKGSSFPGCRHGLVHRSPVGDDDRLLVAVDLLDPPALQLRR